MAVGHHPGMSSRRRPTELARELGRRATAMSIALGREVRDGRVRRRLTQRQLASNVGISQTSLSRIEHGLGVRTPLDSWIAIGIALGRPLAVTFTRPLGEPRGLADAGHLEIPQHMLKLGRATGRHGTFELPTRPNDPAHSTDVGLRDDLHRVLIQTECWNTFGDLGAAIRSTNRKSAEAQVCAIATTLATAEPYAIATTLATAEPYAIATTPATAKPYRVATVWIVRATATNRDLLARYPNIIDAAFPGSSRHWHRALKDGTEPPHEPGILWFDPATCRLTEHRRATMRA